MEEEIMADLNSEFVTFHNRVALTSGKKESLRRSRDAIRDRIRNYFRENLEVEAPKFRGQGSYAMGTTVIPLDGEFDIDDGVYLQHLAENDDSEWPTPDTVHRWLVKAADGHTNEKPVDKRTCVRVRYAGRYHVDLPSYARLNAEYLLAEKGTRHWPRSDPKAVTDWFKDYLKKNGEQLRRVVRYLKAWADHEYDRRGKMPGGLILTVLATQNFRADERDDVSFANTASRISVAVSPVFNLQNPVDASEELTSRLTDGQKERFQDAISELSSAGSDAVNHLSRWRASEIWRGQFGERFPLVEEDDETDDEQQKKNDTARLAAIYVARKPVKPWANE
jgi:hypothetical protein